MDFSFVFFGCNRLGRNPAHPTDSTANKPQLEQTLKDIAALPQAPRFLFFLGDLVLNEKDDDGSQLATQLGHWQTMWDKIKPTNFATTLVPITGNHEVLFSRGYSPSGCDCSDHDCHCDYPEFPNPNTQAKWLSWIKANGHDGFAGNGPTPAAYPKDLLVADNSALSYSFDTKLGSGNKVHFTLVDTDTLSSFASTDNSCLQAGATSRDAIPGWVPANWIAKDVATAQGDSAIDLIFAMGHKPIQEGGWSDPVGYSTVNNCADANPGVADSFLKTLQTNNKVVAYLTSHSHEWRSTTIGNSPTVPQLIVGNAGSPPNGSYRADGVFGFTLVEIYSDGKVTATSYGRPIPAEISDPSNVSPATAQQTVTLRTGSGGPT